LSRGKFFVEFFFNVAYLVLRMVSKYRVQRFGAARCALPTSLFELRRDKTTPEAGFRGQTTAVRGQKINYRGRTIEFGNRTRRRPIRRDYGAASMGPPPSERTGLWRGKQGEGGKKAEGGRRNESIIDIRFRIVNRSSKGRRAKAMKIVYPIRSHF
jgi:hypothetical protein